MLHECSAEELERLRLLAAHLVHAHALRSWQPPRRPHVLMLEVEPEDGHDDQQRQHERRLVLALLERQHCDVREQRHDHAREDIPHGARPEQPARLADRTVVDVHKLVAVRHDHDEERQRHHKGGDWRQDHVHHHDHEHEHNIGAQQLLREQRTWVSQRSQAQPDGVALLLRERRAELAADERRRDWHHAEQLHARAQERPRDHEDDEGRGLARQARTQHVLDGAERLHDELVECGKETAGDRGDEKDLHDHEQRELGEERRLRLRQRHVPLERHEQPEDRRLQRHQQ
mmetsp:Transcript_39258/g.101571  ORF Transcript_39258/g.101571 Transcript_39258/m.101571 type:complete len:288 (-) Transcript_39258:1520-2383(-)